MQPQNNSDYQKLLSELIKKQMLILGPDITLAKVRNVTGIEVDQEGEVTKLEGDPQQILQNTINQFVELSGLIVKKTMESILSTYPGMARLTKGINQGEANQTPVTQTQNEPQAPQALAEPTPNLASSTTSQPPSQSPLPTQQTTQSPDPTDPPVFDPEAQTRRAGGPSSATSELDKLNKILEEMKNEGQKTSEQ